MLDNNGFDKWSERYDKNVASDDVSGEYPFAGYRRVLERVKSMVKTPGGAEILDIGVGTGKFIAGFYAAGARICGVDFSAKMLELARKRMPQAEFQLFDFSSGLPLEIKARKFDYIISAYAFHHLDDSGKAAFLKSLSGNLKRNGMIILADVAFKTAPDLSACRKKAGEKWDDSEIYMVAENLLPLLTGSGLRAAYEQISHCAGILTILAEHAT